MPDSSDDLWAATVGNASVEMAGWQRSEQSMLVTLTHTDDDATDEFFLSREDAESLVDVLAQALHELSGGDGGAHGCILEGSNQ